MPVVIENAGSNARDFCMLERNLLAALKLAALLCVLFASILLRGRLRITDGLTGDDGDIYQEGRGAALSMAGLEFGAAIVVIGAAVQEYHSGVRDLRGQRAFLRSESIHLALMASVSVIILGTCLTLLVAPTLV